jgi:menaquinone-specific isochorismate synthase
MTQTEISIWLQQGAFYRRPGAESSLDLFLGPFSPLENNSQPLNIGWQDFYNSQLSEFTTKNIKYGMLAKDLCYSIKQWLGENLQENSAPVFSRQQFIEPVFSKYELSFDIIQRKIQAKQIQKAVPVAFSTAPHCPALAQRAQWILSLLETSATAHVYGIWSDEFGIMGASPEILFRQKGNKIFTMALAGTLPRSDLGQRLPLLEDKKELSEHDFVVNDLVKQLSPLGTVQVGSARVMELPNLFHLVTDIELEISPEHSTGFSGKKWVELLHPTPALGVFPRSAGHRWLSDLPEQKDRGLFGAPLVFRLNDDELVAVVAIRGVQWGPQGTQIGSGGGIVEESKIDQEWRELEKKRDSVFRSLGM